MNKNPVSVQEALKAAKYAENVEVIELPLEGHQRVLVRSKAMPEFAFLVWSDYKSGTFSWLGLDLPDTIKHDDSAYPVLCACCETQTYGVAVPKRVGKTESMPYVKWADQLGKAFRCTLEETCKKNGITTIFMRKANSWDYGDLNGIEITEASNHQEKMLEHYGRKVIQMSTKFICKQTSRGMFGEH